MITAGIGMISVIRIRNNTDTQINKITLTYDSDCKEIKVKNIKSNENKQTGISTISTVHNLNMTINDGDKSYPIMETIPRGFADKLIITISSFDDNNCDYTVEIEDNL